MVNFEENKENLSCFKEECCKRRNRLRRRRHVPHAMRAPEYVRHRNNRERRRVEAINEAFSVLEKHVPFLCTEERNSKVNILNAAASYIRRLGETLIQTNSVQYHIGTLRPCNRLPTQMPTSTQINQNQNVLTNGELSVNICNDSYLFCNQASKTRLNQEHEINHLVTNRHQYVNHTSITTQSDLDQNYHLDSNMNLTQYDRWPVVPRSGYHFSENEGTSPCGPWTNSSQRNTNYNTTSFNSEDTANNRHDDGAYRNDGWLSHDTTNNLHNNVFDTDVPYFTEASEPNLTRLHTNILDNQQTSTSVPVHNDVIFSDCFTGHHCLDNLCIDSIIGQH